MIRKRLSHIDALRGFAALYVIIFHIERIPVPKLQVPQWLTPFLSLGGSGVTLFFIISAFTLCLTLDGRTEEKNWILKFYIRRAARILPLYYVWLVVMSLITLGYNLIHSKTYILSLTFFVYNFQPGKQEGIVWASWTLGVEMVFYLIFPLLFKVANNLWKSVMLFITSLAVSYIHYRLAYDVKDYKVYLSLFYQFPVFAVGMISYQIYKNYLFILNEQKKAGIILLISSFVLFSVIAITNRYTTNMFVTYQLAVVYSLLLLGLSLTPLKLISNKLTIFLGIISYSLYLNHPVIVNFFISFYRVIYTLKTSIFLKYIVCCSVTVVPLTIISYITYKLVERPGGRLVKYLGQLITMMINLKLKSN